MNRGSAGCGMIFVVVLVIGLAMWLLGGVLALVGVLLPFVSILVAVFTVYFGWSRFFAGRRVAREADQFDRELAGMASDSGARLDQMMMWWERVSLTRGIGTSFEDRMDNLRAASAADPEALRVRELLGEAREVRSLLLDATGPADRSQQLQLINRADRVWADLMRHYLAGTRE